MGQHPVDDLLLMGKRRDDLISNLWIHHSGFDRLDQFRNGLRLLGDQGVVPAIRGERQLSSARELGGWRWGDAPLL